MQLKWNEWCAQDKECEETMSIAMECMWIYIYVIDDKIISKAFYIEVLSWSLNNIEALRNLKFTKHLYDMYENSMYGTDKLFACSLKPELFSGSVNPFALLQILTDCYKF